jgi:GNAT superfamily N-acetyltransferase
MSSQEIRQIETAEELRACFPLMRQLRPHLVDEDDFIRRVASMRAESYAMLAVWQDGQPIALTGYRYQQNLMFGHFLYVDDLVVNERNRSAGHGASLLQTLERMARDRGCSRLVLDTGLSYALAQRFYFRQGLLTGSIGFSKVLGERAS